MNAETYWAEERAKATTAKDRAGTEFDRLRSAVKKARRAGRLTEAGEEAVWDELAAAARQIGDRL